MLTVREALGTGGLKEAALVAGGTGLDREVRHVTVMEVPDLVQWLKGGDFIVTSLFSIKDDLGAQVQLIQDLAKRGCAALAVKTKRYVEALAPEVKAAADAWGFPLIDVPRHVTYIDIISPLMEQLLNREAGILRQADEAFRWLQEIVLSGQGLQAALLALARLVGVPLALECPDLSLCLTAPGETPPYDPLDAETTRHLAVTCRPLRAVRRRGDQTIACLIIPLLFGSYPYAYLSVTDNGADLTPAHRAILEHAAALLAAEIMQLRTRAELERQHVNSFIEELLGQNLVSEDNITERARYLGLDLTRLCLPLAFDIDHFRETIERKGLTEAQVQFLKSRLQRELAYFLRSQQVSFLVGQRSDSLVVLTCWNNPTPGGKDPERAAYQLATASLQHLQQAAPELSLTGGIGRPYAGVRGITKSYREARRAITLGRKAHGPGRVYTFAGLGIYRLLCAYPDEEELRAIRDETLRNV
ncbi:MAG TPA: hypothetical protein GX511_06920, partial [Firmicutes bacterium]|nr:hypothetical protein [Bacillota bacterium]